MKKIGLGIDTGGTCTDGVIYDFEAKKILASAKALTTRQDLTIGIQNVLNSLPQELLKQTDIVGLSTTLATNACVENKGGRAKLLFLGGDKQVVDRVGAQYGFQDLNEIFYEDRVTNLAGEILRQPDWEQFSNTIEDRFGDCDGVGVIEIYAMRNGGVLENEAKRRIEEKLHIPVTCGNELFDDLGSLQRGASALLNARLIPVIHEFLEAVHRSLNTHGISAPIVIMRSDGTVMSEEFARLHPVETLLCGPAASVVGASYTSEAPESVVVDMGGTTTDIALVKNGVPLHAKEGISIGQWKTYVKGLYVDTFGLGGDSAVRFSDNKLYLDSTRVIPLCILAMEYPSVKQKLAELVQREEVNYTRFLHEWVCLMKDISDNPRYTEEERAFCETLKDGPLILIDAAAAAGKDVYTFGFPRLEAEGVILRAGLTPTDIMHWKGDFDRYDKEASALGITYVSHCLGMEPDTFADLVYEEIEKKLYCNIVRILLENSDSYYKKHRVEEEMQRLIENSWYGMDNGFLASLFQTKLSLVGVGAPIHVFLPAVAEKLGTKAIIPEYASVTNAIGAVAGDISVRVNIQILPVVTRDEQDVYMVYCEEGNFAFQELDEAIAQAIIRGTKQVKRELKARGQYEDRPISHTVQEQSGRGFQYYGISWHDCIGMGISDDPLPVNSIEKKNGCHPGNPQAEVVIKAPLRFPLAEIERFAAEKESWIRSTVSRIQGELASKTAFDPLPAGTLPLLGKEYPIQCDKSIFFDGSAFHIPDLPFSEVKPSLQALYRSLAKEIFTGRMALYQDQTGLIPTSIKITSANTRWGSCSEKNAVCFSWKLIFADLRAMDYVVVHELCHIREHNHSPRFWKLVYEILPDFRERRALLKQCQDMLAIQNWD